MIEERLSKSESYNGLRFYNLPSELFGEPNSTVLSPIRSPDMDQAVPSPTEESCLPTRTNKSYKEDLGAFGRALSAS